MKSAISIRTILMITALISTLLTCFAQDDPNDLLVGKWTKVMNERTLTFTMTSDHKYQVDFIGDDASDVWGNFVISGTQITFNDEGGDYGADEPGVYQFQVSESTLTFDPVDDPVYGRSLLMEGSWSRGLNP